MVNQQCVFVCVWLIYALLNSLMCDSIMIYIMMKPHIKGKQCMYKPYKHCCIKSNYYGMGILDRRVNNKMAV